VFDGREGGEKKWRGSPQDLLGLLPSFVSRSYRTRAGARVWERAEGEGVVAGWGSSPGRFAKEREKKEEGKKK
jgi:hypothetical protein